MSGAVVSEMLIRIAADTAALRSEMNEAKRAVVDGFDGIKSAASSLRNTLSGLVAGIGITALAKQFVETADAVSMLEARLKNTVGAGKEFEQAQQAIYKIAQQNNIGLQEATELFTKLNDPVKRLGGGVKETSGIVEAFALSLRLGGASTAEASAATLQFAQAMASGKLQGDEFRSLAEASPVFMKKLAEGMGVPIEQLKKMGSEGKLTADVVGNALLKLLDSMKSEAANLPDTVGGAFQRIKNDVIVMVGELNKNSGLTLGVSDLLETVRTDLLPAIRDELAGAFEAVGGWIQKNREWIAGVWETVKGVAGQVWEAVKAFGSLAGAVAEIVGQSSAWKVVLEGIRLLIAGLQDGFNIIRAAVLWLAGDRAGANAIFDAFKNGQSAVQQYADRIGNAEQRARQMDAALKNGAISASEHNAEMAKLTRQAEGAASSYTKLRPAVKGLTDEQKKAAEAYKKVIDSIEDQTGALIAEASATEKMTGAQKTALKIMQDIQQGRLKLTDAQKREVVSKLELLIATEKESAKNKELIDLKQKVAQHSQKLTDAQWDEVEALRKGNAALIEQNDQLRLGEAAISAREIAVLRSQAADLEWQAAMEGGNAALEEQARLLRDRARLLEEGQAIKAAQDTTKAWRETAQAIEDDLTDALMRGFESGKSIFQNLRDTVVNMFRTLVLRPVIQAIVAPVAGVITGALGLPGTANAAQGGMGGFDMLGGIKSAYDMIAGGFAGLGNSVAFAAQDIGAWLVNNTTGVLNQFGGSLMSNAGMLGTGASYLGGAGAGLALGNLISGGYSAIGKSGNTANVIGTGVGAVLGGPVGAAIGGAVGGLVNRAFGRKLKDYGIEGTFGAGDGFEGNSFKFYKGGWFRSNKTKRSALDPEIDRFLTDTYNKIKASTKDMAESLGLNADQIDGFTQKVKISTKGLSEEQITQKLTEQFGSVRDGMIALYKDALIPFQKEGESLTQTFERLSVIQQFREAINPLGGIFSQVAAASVQAQENIIALSGGLESFLGKAKAFVNDYYTESEKVGMAAKGVAEKLEAVGIDLAAMGVDTRAEFRALVESIDVTTKAGQEQLAVLLEVAPQFAQLADVMQAQNTTLDKLAAQAPVVDALGKLISPQEQAAQATQNVAQGVQQSNRLLAAIGGKLDAFSQIANAAVAAAQAAASAAAGAAAAASNAASSASLAASRPTYTADIGAAR